MNLIFRWVLRGLLYSVAVESNEWQSQLIRFVGETLLPQFCLHPSPVVVDNFAMNALRTKMWLGQSRGPVSRPIFTSYPVSEKSICSTQSSFTTQRRTDTVSMKCLCSVQIASVNCLSFASIRFRRNCIEHFLFVFLLWDALVHINSNETLSSSFASAFNHHRRNPNTAIYFQLKPFEDD